MPPGTILVEHFLLRYLIPLTFQSENNVEKGKRGAMVVDTLEFVRVSAWNMEVLEY